MLKETITPTKDNKICIELTLNNAEQPSLLSYNQENTLTYLTVTTNTLMKLLNCGKQTAIEIGTNANAKIHIGRRVLWNVNLIQKYLDSIAF